MGSDLKFGFDLVSSNILFVRVHLVSRVRIWFSLVSWVWLMFGLVSSFLHSPCPWLHSLNSRDMNVIAFTVFKHKIVMQKQRR